MVILVFLNLIALEFTFVYESKDLIFLEKLCVKQKIKIFLNFYKFHLFAVYVDIIFCLNKICLKMSKLVQMVTKKVLIF